MDTIPVKRRTRSWTEHERDELVKAYRASGKTQRAFCEGAGLSVGALTLWLRKRRGVVKEGRLLEVPMARVVNAAGTAGGVEVILPAMVVRVAAGTTISWASELIRKLQCGA